MHFDLHANVMQQLWRAVVCVSVFLGHCIVALRLSSVTDDVKLGDARGNVAAFADLNADKATDILLRAGRPYTLPWLATY